MFNENRSCIEIFYENEYRKSAECLMKTEVVLKSPFEYYLNIS